MIGKKSRNKDDHVSYFSAKKAKLSEQFLEEKRILKELPPQIFSGIRVYVNGYTVPPAEELKSLIVKHGGIYSVFLDSSVTHMVANVLPDTKLKFLNKVKVVRPEWILDSVNKERILSCTEYLTYNHTKDQRRILWSTSEEKSVSSCTRDQASTSSSSMINTSPISTGEGNSVPSKNDVGVGVDVNSYHSRSRLHFISTMKMELREYVSKLKDEKKSSFPGLEKLKSLSKEKNSNSQSIYSQREGRCDEGDSSARIVIHIDMDCFFVSVSRCGRPELINKPVVVTSSKIPNYGAHYNEMKDSMADIACCSYEARAAGVKNGMTVGQALQICPNLVAVPYEFEKYRSVSTKMYEIATSYTLDLEPVSCDELYIDCTDALMEVKCSPIEFAEHIRNAIKEETGCSASAGIGANRIQARLATKKAKPNGTFYLAPEDVKSFMQAVPSRDLPGVGPMVGRKLKELNLFNCGQLYEWGLLKLEREFGPGTGKALYMHCQGLEPVSKDFHNVLQPKSVSSEVNYGIRFTQFAEAEETLINISKSVASKLKSEGRSITLKLKVRSPDAPVTSAKYLGHGICDNVSRTFTLDAPTSDPDVISKIAIDLLKKTKVSIFDIRGIGIMMNKLEESCTVQKKPSIKTFFKTGVDFEEYFCQMKNKSAALSNDIFQNTGIHTGVHDVNLSEIGTSFNASSSEELNCVRAVSEEIKQFLGTEKPPYNFIKSKILSILLNEVSNVNISSVDSSLRELKRLLEGVNGKERNKWYSLLHEIAVAVYKEVSKVIGYPIKNILLFDGGL